MVTYLGDVTLSQSKFYHNIFVKGLSPIINKGEIESPMFGVGN
jgi:hypothetical protein